MGVEYVFMTISLFAAAGGLTAALLSLVNGKISFDVLAFPTALLIVSVPVFALLFLHAKRQELRSPGLRQDPSKRRSTQFTQIVSFLVCLFTLVGLVSAIFMKLGGQSDGPLWRIALDCLVLIVVFGGMLAYYWRDEHVNR
jgi:divalent metal cation (Fe/Co/Zn/Cd) transporter